MKTTLVKSYHFESVDSTMNVAKMLAMKSEVSELPIVGEVDIKCSQLSDLAVITADEQVSGRGRFVRHWHSEKGAGLYVTYQFSIPVGFSKLNGFSLAVGVAVKRVVDKFAVRAKLKWPNDVVVFNEQNELCKLAGILVELVSVGSGDSERLYVSTGIGLNLKQTLYPANLMQKAISLEELSGSNEVRRDDLQQKLNAEFWKVCDEYFMNGFCAGFKAEWEKHNACAGMRVKVSSGTGMGFVGAGPCACPAVGWGALREQVGTMIGVDDDGNLLLRDEQTNEIARISIGDVSLNMA